jgi:outer membrane protein assembly factor BamE (lipoprotein component of BamABCDE complex)
MTVGTRFSVENTQRIQEGMTKEEVEAIMGRPRTVSSHVTMGHRYKTWMYHYTEVGAVPIPLPYVSMAVSKAKSSMFMVKFTDGLVSSLHSRGSETDGMRVF